MDLERSLEIESEIGLMGYQAKQGVETLAKGVSKETTEKPETVSGVLDILGVVSRKNEKMLEDLKKRMLQTVCHDVEL